MAGVEKSSSCLQSAPCLHVNFASMCVRGGVLAGGCVQEEIRYAVCPENRAAMLFCPNLRNGEAIRLAGSKQFSAYCSYAFGLKNAADHMDQCEEPAARSVILRELNKTAAAFNLVAACTSVSPHAHQG